MSNLPDSVLTMSTYGSSTGRCTWACRPFALINKVWGRDIPTSAISLPLLHQRTLASLQYPSPPNRERGHVRLLKGGFVIYDYDEALFPQPWEAGCSWTRKIRPLTCIKAAHVVYIQLGCHKENVHRRSTASNIFITVKNGRCPY